jgi:hypothetical protein
MIIDDIYAKLEKERNGADNYNTDISKYIRELVETDDNWTYLGNGTYEKKAYLSKNQFTFMYGDPYDVKNIIQKMCQAVYPADSDSKTLVTILCNWSNPNYQINIWLQPKPTPKPKPTPTPST